MYTSKCIHLHLIYSQALRLNIHTKAAVKREDIEWVGHHDTNPL